MGAQQTFGDLMRRWRKSRGLSQLDLASRAEVSTRHISFLETGRSGPSREMVLRLCRFLDVPLRERNLLLESAGFSPTFRAGSLDDPELRPVWDALRRLVEHHAPWGAIVCDRAWNLRLANRPFSMMMAGLLPSWPAAITTTGAEVNLMKLFFDPEGGIRDRVTNFDQIAPSILEHIRADARLPNAPPAVRQLHDDLEKLAGPLQEGRGPVLPLVPLVIDVGSLELRLFTAVTTLASPLDITLSELRVETYFPADEPTKRFMEMMAADTSGTESG